MSYPGGYGAQPGPGQPGQPGQGGQAGHPGQGQPGQGGGPAFGQPPAPPNPLARLGLPGVLTLVILVLSLVVYFVSFGGGVGLETALLLGGGLLGAMALLPRGPRVLPFAALLSVVGGLTALADVIAVGGSPATSSILIMVFGLLQAAAAAAAVLLDAGVIKTTPRPAVPHGYGPPTAFTPPATQFMQQPGQFGGPQGGGPSRP